MTKRLVILPIGLSLCQDWPYENLYKGAILGEGYPLLLGKRGDILTLPASLSRVYLPPPQQGVGTMDHGLETHGPWTMGVEEDRVLGLSRGGRDTAARGS